VLYPLHLDVAGKRVLVVGGGPVAVRRARAAAACGADVLLVAPEAPADPGVRVELRAFSPADLDGAWLVLTCTGVVDDEVAALCRERRIWCVRSDDHRASDAWVPAVARVEEVVVSVTSGRDPRRSVALRDQVVARWRELDRGPS
jgi:uroporphyrin-III C-methyltransferase/precorrin-2 dehydrogenase/sirohydrochlorin ferrochelatase